MPFFSMVAIFAASSAESAVPVKTTSLVFQSSQEWSFAPK